MFLNERPSLEEFYKNPAGSGITSMSIGTIKDSYIKRYNYMKEKGKKFDCNIYKEHDSSYYYHIIVPSEQNTNNYDVVIHMTNDEVTGNMKKWKFEVFSNSPGFVFTYAYIYANTELLIPWLSDKYPKEIFSKMPLERNPDLVLSYDKSVFFAIHTIMSNISLNQRVGINFKSKPLNLKELKEKIRDLDTVLKECEKSKTKQVRVIKVDALKDTAVDKLVKTAKKALGKDTQKERGTVVKRERSTVRVIKPKAKIKAKKKIR